MKFKILLFFITAIALASCVDIPDFDDTPKIFYNSIGTETEFDTSGKKIQENITVTMILKTEMVIWALRMPK